MLQSLLQECLDRRKAELLEKYDTKYFEQQKKKFLGEEISEETPALFTRELLSDEERMEDMQYIETIEAADTNTASEKLDLPVTLEETTDNNATLEIDANKVKQIVVYFFNGIKSGMTVLDQIASTIEFCGRAVFEQACYESSLLLGKCIDVDYEFMET
ncbi:MAG: hypothetical protein AAGJ08_09260 [Cyanobacteria bacterium P01_H01_bin.35]